MFTHVYTQYLSATPTPPPFNELDHVAMPMNLEAESNLNIEQDTLDHRVLGLQLALSKLFGLQLESTKEQFNFAKT